VIVEALISEFGDTKSALEWNFVEALFSGLSEENQELIGQRKTFVMDREKSGKMKNKRGYRKTVQSMNRVV